MRNLELGGHGDEYARQVAERLDQRLLVLARDDDRRRVLPPALEQLDSLLGRRLVEGVAGDQAERAGGGVIAERGTQRGARSLLVDLDREVARRRRERDATARELRRADRALAGTPGSLLAPRLRAAAGDEPAALRRARALAARIQLGAHGLVHEVRPDLGCEDGLVERDLL